MKLASTLTAVTTPPAVSNVTSTQTLAMAGAAAVSSAETWADTADAGTMVPPTVITPVVALRTTVPQRRGLLSWPRNAPAGNGEVWTLT